MAGHLTTHVLDTAQGKPAAHMSITLWKLGPGNDDRHFIKTVRTNADGRTSTPLLAESEFQPGTYQLEFAVGEYFAAQSVVISTPPFLEHVPVRFTITDPEAHYHIPLLTSPWAYSTYRGS